MDGKALALAVQTVRMGATNMAVTNGTASFVDGRVMVLAAQIARTDAMNMIRARNAGSVAGRGSALGVPTVLAVATSIDWRPKVPD